jgi:ABC-type Fe3+-citrate transport system substrate-binding protein
LAGLAFRHHLAVVLDAERIRAEHERVLTVIKRIEKNLNRVGVVEISIAASLADQDVVWLGVEADDANIEILPVEEKRISVRSVAGWPSFGSCWTNALKGSVLVQIAS